MTHTNPVIPSKGIIFCNPDAISLNSGSPTSIFSHHKFSDSGCFHTYFNSPTLTSINYSKNNGSLGSKSGAAYLGAFFLGFYYLSSTLLFFLLSLFSVAALLFYYYYFFLSLAYSASLGGA